MPVDVCDIVADVIDAVLNRNDSDIICKLTIPADVRVIGNHALLHDMIVRKEFLTHYYSRFTVWSCKWSWT